MSNIENTQQSFEDWRPRFSPWIIAISVMLATFMEVLDTSVANVALPNIAGSFSATTDEATWVLTSYLVANAIILPASAWFGNLFGRKNFLLICITLFTLASLMCGVSNSLEMLIISRVLQGIGGGALQPISQAILLESFPVAKRGIAMAVFGMGVVFAPIIGPTLGGWITDNYSWHWVFLINIPVGMLALLMTQSFVEDPIMIKQAKTTKIDYLGFGFMALWLATLQIILDNGQRAEWFASKWVVWFTLISAISFVLFILWELRTKEPIVNLRTFSNKNFAVGVLLVTAVGAVLYGTLAMLPLYLQLLMDYTSELSGLSISPRGIGAFFTIILVGRLVNKVDNRILTVLGFIVLGYSCHILGNINLYIGMGNIIWPNILSGVALGLIFIPLSTLSFATLKNEELGNATGIYNLMRNIGGSVGISAVSNSLSTQAQVHQANMVSYLTPYDITYQQRLADIAQYLSLKSGTTEASQQAQGVIYGTLVKQASLWAFVDNFRGFFILCMILIPLIFLFKNVKTSVETQNLH